MSHTTTGSARSRIAAALSVLTLMLGFFTLTPTVAQALTTAPTASVAQSSARDCHSGDLNDCQVSAFDDDDSDEEQGPLNRVTIIETKTPVRSLSIRCHLTQSPSEECKPYLHGTTFAQNVFAEGTEYDDELQASFVNGRGGETMCWVGTKAWPCSVLLKDYLANATPIDRGQNDVVQSLNEQDVDTFSDDDEYTEQRSAPTPIGGCPLAPSTPCYQFRS